MLHRRLTLLAIAAAAVGLACAAASAQEINPYPRATLRVEKLTAWTFDTGPAGWTAAHSATLAAAGGVLRYTITGDDPYVFGPPMKVAAPTAVRLHLRTKAAGSGQIFWTTAESPGWDQAKSTHFPIQNDGQWHDAEVAVAPAGTLTRLRLDINADSGEVEIGRIEAVRVVLHPLEIEKVEAAGREVAATLRNHSDAAVEFTFAGGPTKTIAAASTLRLTAQAAAATPFEAMRVTVQPKGLLPIQRTVYLYHADAKAPFVSAEAGDLAVRAAADGLGAVVELQGKVVAVLCPILMSDGAAVPLRPTADKGTLRLVGNGATVTLTPRGSEVAISVISARPVEGPVVRAVGGLERGVFAGLEYLGKGERSSSTLDIETPEHVRYAPDPLKVTMPLMAFLTDRAAVALTWQDMTLQPVYATPNFFDGTPDHRMTLRGTKFDAALLVSRTTIEETILWAVRRRGLPPLPREPRDRAAQWRLCLDSLNGPVKGEGGWGHCAEPRWNRAPFADIAAALWRLTGEPPALEKLTPGGGHIKNDSLYFATGRAAEWLRVRRGEAQGQIRSQQPDGSWRYSGEYRRGHFEDTASGFCGRPAASLLDFAYATGDADALAAGLKALDYMKRFDVPRGAQTWECPLHTPDILASAHLVRAYVRGYELTGRKEYLDEARRWALTGLPFVYQWGRYPVMPYATIAVYGATNWKAPNWIGLPVQWCGLVYADSLALLAPHEKTLDWARVARGILIAGEQMRPTTGPWLGTLPDSWDLASQTGRPWMINPSALVFLRMTLDGGAPGLSVATAGGRRVTAPYPVAIKDGRAIVRAKAGAAYQLLIDGKRIVDVKSHGTDEVPLD